MPFSWLRICYRSEIMQYFVAYGYMGILGVLVVFSLFLYVGVSFVMAVTKISFQKK